MKRIEVDTWDQGRLLVNRDFAEVLEAHQLTTFTSLMDRALGPVVKAAVKHRMTGRLDLEHEGGSLTLFIKRHEAAPLKEYIKPLLRLSRPIVGARNEWDALLKFQELGIPTMMPVAYGRSGRRSFLLTLGIEGCTKLSEWMSAHLGPLDDLMRDKTRTIARRVGRTVRILHEAGLHHQDLYLGHLMMPDDEADERIFIIDLGRVDTHFRWSKRWIIKDLAQLDFSADHFSRTDRMRFLHAYLDRSVQRSDRPLVWLIRRKANAIRRHARKR